MLDQNPPTSSDKFFSQADADRIFNELKDLQVDLDDDPLAFGPKRLNNKVSEVRRMLARCERIFLDMSQKFHFCRRQLKIATLNLELSKKHLLANDPDVRAGRSVADRDAIAAGKLASEIHIVHELEMSEQDLGSVLQVVKAKRTDLKDAEGRLRDQIRICQEEIGLGARWGSRASKASDIDLTPGIATPADLSSMNDLLVGVDGEIHLSEIKEEEREKKALSESLTEEVDLENVLPSTTTAADTDSFLELNISETPVLRKSRKDVPVLDDSVLDDLLKVFENPALGVDKVS
jgi:hypothetical protein